MSTRTALPRILAVAASAVLTLAACGGGDDEAASTTAPVAGDAGSSTAAPGEPVIEIAGFAFAGPASVPAGSVVTVVNNDSAPHTLTADDGSFDTGTIQPGDSVEITLSTAGTVAFHCDIHGSMQGSIDVT